MKISNKRIVIFSAILLCVVFLFSVVMSQNKYDAVYPEYRALSYVELNNNYKNIKVKVSDKKITSKDELDTLVQKYITKNLGYMPVKNIDNLNKDNSKVVFVRIKYNKYVDSKLDVEYSMPDFGIVKYTDLDYNVQKICMGHSGNSHIDDTLGNVRYDIYLDGFFKEYGVSNINVKKASNGLYKTTSELLDALKKESENYNLLDYNARYRDAVLAEASKCGVVKSVPSELINWYVNIQMSIFKDEADSYNISLSKYLEKMYNLNEEQMERRLRKEAPDKLHDELVLRAIGEKEGITVSDSDVDVVVLDLAEKEKVEESVIKEKYSEDVLKNIAYTNKIYEFLKLNTK